MIKFSSYVYDSLLSVFIVFTVCYHVHIIMRIMQ